MSLERMADEALSRIPEDQVPMGQSLAAVVAGLEAVRRAILDGRAVGDEVNRVISVSAVPTEVVLDVVSYTMFNDGPSAVFTSQNGPQVITSTAVNPQLNSNESDTRSLGQRTRVRFWIACAAGNTATVRVRGIV